MTIVVIPLGGAEEEQSLKMKQKFLKRSDNFNFMEIKAMFYNIKL